jgi:glycosyltransferase involved in cell wall biosynthesis
MKIAIASLGDPSSVATWSGIPSTILSSLRDRGHEVFSIALKKPREPWYFNWRRRIHGRLEGKWFLVSVERSWLQPISRQLDDAVREIDPEVVLVIHADWLAYSTFDCPACIIHDTTFDSIVDYYPTFSNLSKRSLRNGHEMYQRALDKCVAAIYPAEWATQSAITRYRLPATKAFTVPFGANINRPPEPGDVDRWIDQRLESETCHFVFIGTQWKRKGGPQVLEFVSELNRLGIDSHVSIVGCHGEVPAHLVRYVTQVGYLRKDNPEHLTRLTELFSRSHALIVLSEAECYGCVYCEANAYGLPALGRDTGGVSEIIRDGVNGLLLKRDESIQSLAARWAQIWRNRSFYKEVAHNSYREFRERLNYTVFSNKLGNILTALVESKN